LSVHPKNHCTFLNLCTKLIYRKKRTQITPRNAIVRKIRLEAHKMYILALIASFRHLNHLLSSPSLLTHLHAYVPPATKNALTTGPEHTQARRTIAFLSGLKDLVSTWSSKWKETKRGWRRPRWVDHDDLGKVFRIVRDLSDVDSFASRLE
jgi:xeroderma pigmentosum group C-complementing protein